MFWAAQDLLSTGPQRLVPSFCYKHQLTQLLTEFKSEAFCSLPNLNVSLAPVVTRSYYLGEYVRLCECLQHPEFPDIHDEAEVHWEDPGPRDGVLLGLGLCLTGCVHANLITKSNLERNAVSLLLIKLPFFRHLTRMKETLTLASIG